MQALLYTARNNQVSRFQMDESASFSRRDVEVDLGNRDETSEVLDSHCHFWHLQRGDYDWLQGSNESLAKIRRDFQPTEYPATRRVVAVQAAATVEETDYLLDLAEENNFIAAVVGWADLSSRGTIAVLEERAANPKFKSVRPMLQDIAETDWLLTAPHPEILRSLTSLGLRFDALITERHLPVLAQFAAKNPELPIVVDHGAKPQPGDKSAWDAGMRVLARDPRIYCKLSGLLTELSIEELKNPLPALRETFARLLDWFGADRIMWGSDWPVLTLAASYEEWRSYTETLLAELSASEREAVLGGNSKRFYGLSD